LVAEVVWRKRFSFLRQKMPKTEKFRPEFIPFKTQIFGRLGKSKYNATSLFNYGNPLLKLWLA